MEVARARKVKRGHANLLGGLIACCHQPKKPSTLLPDGVVRGLTRTHVTHIPELPLSQ